MYDMYDDGSELKERNLIWAFVLSFITFGIYTLYWLYHLQKDSTRLMGLRDETSPALVVVLNLVTFGVYTVYWAWKMGDRFRREARNRGSNEADHCPSLYLILQLFNFLVGISAIVNMLLMQDRLNQLLRMRSMGRQAYDPERFRHVPERDIARKYQARARAYEAEAAADEELQAALAAAEGRRALFLEEGAPVDPDAADPEEGAPVDPDAADPADEKATRG